MAEENTVRRGEDFGCCGGGGWKWTEERHAWFMNRLEESVVWAGVGAGFALDRVIPDSATESNRGRVSHQRSDRFACPRPQQRRQRRRRQRKDTRFGCQDSCSSNSATQD